MSSGAMLSLLKTFTDMQILFAAVTHLDERLILETLLTLKVSKSLICLVGTRRPTVYTTEHRLILFLKTLMRNKATTLCHLE
jgi:hypothetical protein